MKGGATLHNPIFLSGLHSGVNPSPGLGTARSILTEWSDAHLEAVDYSSLATGISSKLFRARHILPPWNEVDLSMYCEQMHGMVAEQGAVFISGLDLETQVLAAHGLDPQKGFLIPSSDSFQLILKPSQVVARYLGFRTPASVKTRDVNEAIDFAADCGWPVWVKGENYEALKAWNATEVVGAFRYIQETWSTGAIIQEHVEGNEESIAFAAFEGDVLGACVMRKIIVTGEGKTWGGVVRGVEGPEADSLSQLVRDLNWTGGAEIELVRSRSDNSLYLIDFNPRFPAWIHGATICGWNLPAALVSGALGVQMDQKASGTSNHGHAQFVRVVEEIPGVALPSPTHGYVESVFRASTKGHPSGMPLLSSRLGPSKLAASVLSPVPDDDPRVAVLENEHRNHSETVSLTRVWFPGVLEEQASSLEETARLVLESTQAELRFAYSIKTNPSPLVVREVRRLGFMAEAISLGEVAHSIELGFPSKSIILNGPGKWWPAELMSCASHLKAVHCDSIEDTRTTLTKLRSGLASAEIVGVRLSPIGQESRFGIDVTNPTEFGDLCGLLPELAEYGTLGLHFHFASSTLGSKRWTNELAGVLTMARGIEDSVDVVFHNIDMGGGWPPGAPIRNRCSILEAVRTSQEILTDPHSFVVEPGKSLVEPTMALLSEVLEVRRVGGSRAAIVSAAISDLPDSSSLQNEIWWRRRQDGRWYVLGGGSDMILGRICMEQDVIRRAICLPEEFEPGQPVAFMNAGAYDVSMSYSFGLGASNGFA